MFTTKSLITTVVIHSSSPDIGLDREILYNPLGRTVISKVISVTKYFWDFLGEVVATPVKVSITVSFSVKKT